ncbi:hypothetical protein [Moraxella lacunata]
MRESMVMELTTRVERSRRDFAMINCQQKFVRIIKDLGDELMNFL